MAEHIRLLEGDVDRRDKQRWPEHRTARTLCGQVVPDAQVRDISPTAEVCCPQCQRLLEAWLEADGVHEVTPRRLRALRTVKRQRGGVGGSQERQLVDERRDAA
jgi:hypothetical protein